MNIKKVKLLDKKGFTLFLNEKEFQLIEEALIRNLIMSRDIVTENAKSNRIHTSEIRIMEKLQNRMWNKHPHLL